MAVMTLKQFTPSVCAAIMSDWIPAPDEGSDPPIDNMFNKSPLLPMVIALIK
jgi:hypothetical protein